MTKKEDDQFNPGKNVGDSYWSFETGEKKKKTRHEGEESSYSDELREQEENPESPLGDDSSFEKKIGTNLQGQEAASWRQNVTEDDSNVTFLGRIRAKNKFLVIGGGGAGLFVILILSFFLITTITPFFSMVAMKEVLLQKFDDRRQTLDKSRNIRLMNKMISRDPADFQEDCEVRAWVKCRFVGLTEDEKNKIETRNLGSKVTTVKLNNTCVKQSDDPLDEESCGVISIEIPNDIEPGKTQQRKKYTPEFSEVIKQSTFFRDMLNNFNKSTVAHWRDFKTLSLWQLLGVSNLPDAHTEGVCLTNPDTSFAAYAVNAADDIKNGASTKEDENTLHHIAACASEVNSIDSKDQSAFDSRGYAYASEGIIGDEAEPGSEAGNKLVTGFSKLAMMNNRLNGFYILSKDNAKKYDTFSDNAQDGRYSDDTKKPIKDGGGWIGPTSYNVPKKISSFSHFAVKTTAAKLLSHDQLVDLPGGITNLAMSVVSGPKALARTMIEDEYNSCDTSTSEKARDPLCVPSVGLDPRKVNADLDFVNDNKKDYRGDEFKPTSSMNKDYDDDRLINYMLNPSGGGEKGGHSNNNGTQGGLGDIKVNCSPCDRGPAYWMWQRQIDQYGNPITGGSVACNPPIPPCPSSQDLGTPVYAQFIQKCLETTEEDPIVPVGSLPNMCADPDTMPDGGEAGILYKEFFNKIRMYCYDSAFDDQYADGALKNHGCSLCKGVTAQYSLPASMTVYTSTKDDCGKAKITCPDDDPKLWTTRDRWSANNIQFTNVCQQKM